MTPLRFGRWSQAPAPEIELDYEVEQNIDLRRADLPALRGNGPEIDPDDIPLFDKIQWVRGRL